MSTFGLPRGLAIVAFPLLFLALVVPFITYHYKKYKSLSVWHAAMIISFAFYMTVAYFTVILPLPTKSDIAYLQSVHAATTNFDITYAFKIFFLYNPMFHGGGLKAGLLAPTFNQLIFNILLTVPFGMYLRFYFKRNFWQTLVLTIGLTLFYELTQLSALYGIYPRPYRLFDVDDLLLNTIGGVVGFCAAPIMNLLFPSRAEMDLHAADLAHRITAVRRVLTFAIDVILSSLLSVGLSLLTVPSWWQDLTAYAIFFGIIPYFAGDTVGQWITGLKYDVFQNQRWRLLIRNALLVGIVLIFMPFWFIALRQTLVDPLPVETLHTYQTFLAMFAFVIIIAVIDSAMVIFNPEHQLLYERITKVTTIVKATEESD